MQVFTSWAPPSGALGRILADTSRRIAPLRRRAAKLESAAAAASEPPSFLDALDRPTVAVIAEIKRRSPSNGSINPGLSVGAQAAAYERGGAAAISVLTETTSFGGAPHDLREAGAASGRPLLRKDFLIDPLQIVEARALGASAVLLIARALPPSMLATMIAEARGLALEPLVEVHDRDELERALALDTAVVGVNSRDLETLVIDRTVHDRLLPLVPEDRRAIAESGMATPADVRRAAAAGADAVLIGTALSSSPDPVATLRTLTGIFRIDRAG
ncbi:MAG TPA: indole-3-glycerol phosphate synthase TrpC [Gemmatimonadaceae bacterium]|nr:indole-3-glycerol phosphate synthase TrpC [Gemmatimonadaceae bacterium]